MQPLPESEPAHLIGRRSRLDRADHLSHHLSTGFQEAAVRRSALSLFELGSDLAERFDLSASQADDLQCVQEVVERTAFGQLKYRRIADAATRLE